MKEARHFGDLAGPFLKKVDPKGRRFDVRAVDAWRQAVGDEVRKHTRGVALRNGELIVSVDSPAWATELSLMSERFRVKMNSELGEELVRSVRFNVSRGVKAEREWERERQVEAEFYTKDKVESVPLTDLERSQVEYCASAIADPELREAAVRAMTKDLEWKKALKRRNEP